MAGWFKQPRKEQEPGNLMGFSQILQSFANQLPILQNPHIHRTHPSMPLLEVISMSHTHSRAIQAAGANRIQLVAALEIGGLTPSATVIRKSIEAVDIPTVVMARHHNMGFLLSDSDRELLFDELAFLNDMHVSGIVVGGLNQQGQADLGLLQYIKETLSGKMEIVFHKAIDQAKNILPSLERLSKYGITRVLTQGGVAPLLQNKEILHKMQISAENTQLELLFGGGITHENVKQIVKEFDAKQIHIGTCVHENKFGEIDQARLLEFIQKMKQV